MGLLCRNDGCDKMAVRGGMCKKCAAAAGVKAGLCKRCTKTAAQRRGLCIKCMAREEKREMGYLCRNDGCDKTADRGGMCRKCAAATGNPAKDLAICFQS